MIEQIMKDLSELYTVKDLYEGNHDIPNEIGIYVIIKPKEMAINFLSNTKAITEYNGKNMLYDSNILQSKFEHSDKNILYIGKAARSNKLKGRLKQLVLYGNKEKLINNGNRPVVNHRGGRAIWQIENCMGLLVGWMLCGHAGEFEKELLKEYMNKYGVLPVANWKIG